MVRFGGDTSEGVGFCGVCIDCLSVVIILFDCKDGGVECVLVLSPSEVGMVTPYECYVGTCSEGGVNVVGIMSGVFARVPRWCGRGTFLSVMALLVWKMSGC